MLKVFIFFTILASVFSAQSSEFLCNEGALYAPINRRIGTLPNQAECLRAVEMSKWGLVCSGGGLLINSQGLSVIHYFDQELCLVSLEYSSFAPSQICAGRILKNLVGGNITSFSTPEACLEAMGKR